MSRSNTTDSLADLARERFDTLVDGTGHEELLREYDGHLFQFSATDAGDVFVAISDGDVTVSTGAPDVGGLDESPTKISAGSDTLQAVFAGEETIVDGVWDEEKDVQAPVYGARMHYMSWISRLLKATRDARS